MRKIDLKSVKIALNRDEMEEIVGGCGGTFGWGNAYTFGCYGGTMIYWSDYNVFGIAFATKQVGSVSC